jgi:alkanesulfonate monooxygenase SsuD/methylene tetrahydromethanopterin reductase-like flavin-dependent oxidoreductase (luciferase family)
MTVAMKFGLWLNEEHFVQAEGGRERLNVHGSPIVLATALAMVTQRIRLGFSVLLLPLHHPLRLAEEIATLDVLSGGRVNFGISRGANSRYMAGFGFVGDPGLVFRDDLATILGYWRGEPVIVAGAPFIVAPAPVQRPHPPVFIGGYTDETCAWVAEHGFALMQHGIESPTVLERCLRTYRLHGGDVASVPVSRFCYVGETDASARAEAWPVVVRQAARLHQIGLHRRPDPVITEPELEPERFYAETAIVGGPETVARRISELRDELGVRYVNLLSAFFGYLPEARLRTSLALFAHEVMPRLGMAALAVLMLAGTLGAGCAPTPPAAPVAPTPAPTPLRMLTDMAGRSVALPSPVRHVATVGAVPVINSFVFALGEGGTIVNGLPPFAGEPALEVPVYFRTEHCQCAGHAGVQQRAQHRGAPEGKA